MDIEKIKSKKELYAKIAKLYHDLDLLRWRKQCGEFITLYDTRNITITDNNICQNIYELVINNLVEQINEYEKELDNMKGVNY